MNCKFKEKEMVLPRGFFVKEGREWCMLHHKSGERAIAGISSGCTISEFRRKIRLHISNFRSFLKVLTPALD